MFLINSATVVPLVTQEQRLRAHIRLLERQVWERDELLRDIRKAYADTRSKVPEKQFFGRFALDNACVRAGRLLGSFDGSAA